MLHFFKVTLKYFLQSTLIKDGRGKNRYHAHFSWTLQAYTVLLIREKIPKNPCCHISFTQMVIEVRYILEELTLVVTKVYVGSKIICSKMLCNAANKLPNWKWQLGFKDILEVCGQCIKNLKTVFNQNIKICFCSCGKGLRILMGKVFRGIKKL